MISFRKGSWENITKDIATIYGIENYTLEVKSRRMFQNDWGSHEYVDGTHKITIRASKIFRAVTIYTIFHEFAHAAQQEYELGINLGKERDAEVIVFSLMMMNGYRWEATYVLYRHLMVGALPREYNARSQIWEILTTGTDKYIKELQEKKAVSTNTSHLYALHNDSIPKSCHATKRSKLTCVTGTLDRAKTVVSNEMIARISGFSVDYN